MKKGQKIKVLNEEEKQKIEVKFLGNILSILALNGLGLVDLNSKMLTTLPMIYQQGLKDAKELLTQKNKI